MLGPSIVIERERFALDMAAYGIIRTGRNWDVKEPNAGHDVRVDVRLGTARRFGVGGRLYSVVASIEPWQITQPEQGLAALLLRRDYLDYYGRHGGQVSGSWFINEKATITAGYADERWSSRDARNVFTVFRGDTKWRDNPLMDEGDVHLFTLDATFDTRNDADDPSGGWYITGNYELGTSGAFSRRSSSAALPPPTPTYDPVTSLRYQRVFFDVRRYNRLSPRTQLNGRIVTGGWVGGDALPLERTLSIGGIGTIPGYDFRRPVGTVDVQTCGMPGQIALNAEARCDRVFLAQLEFRTELAAAPFTVANSPRVRIRPAGFTARPVGVLFFDTGRGWRTEGWSDQFKSDAGAGIDLGLLGVYVAKALTDWSEPVNLLVRVRRRF
jgi:outer membrane protein assembly factor BamA